jgi:pimeloyl-ACP methyl ester carboxylesterase
MKILKGYCDSPFGQIHWRMMGEEDGRDIYCLHPAPFSGLAFATIMPFLATGRSVIAPDYPGHGGSDPMNMDPSIANYAASMGAVMADLSGTQPVDILGFHTGCLVASAIEAKYINQIVMLDVPYFDQQGRIDLFSEAAQPFEITSGLDCLSGPWERGMTRRIASQGVARSFEMFTEQLRHGTKMNAAFSAALAFDCEYAFAKLQRPTTVIATQSPLLDPTRAAAKIIEGARLVERLDIGRSVLDEAAETIAVEILRGLST